MITLTRKSKSGSSSQNHIIFTEENPHPNSLAASILLKNDLMIQDEKLLELCTWLKFREEYLNKILKQKGDLVCKYCGKQHLEIGGRELKDFHGNNKNKNLATIDHINPLSNDGKKYDETNMCVDCKKCNGKKGNKNIDEFINKNKS